ncbi:MAG: Uma2 family endonuclease [Acidimicrobiales bacterium]
MVPLVRYRFSVDDYHRMADAGVLGEGDRVELLDGEILMMAPIGDRHGWCVIKFTDVLVHGSQRRAWVSVQGPVRLGPWSEPHPDLALLRRSPRESPSGHPGPDDVLLLVEVSDTTLRFDRDFKVPLYAAAGVAEVWVVDLQSETILVFREPAGTAYASVTQARRGNVISPGALPDLLVAVDDVLP